MDTYFVELLKPDLSEKAIPLTSEIVLQCEKYAEEYNVQLLFYMQLKRYFKFHGEAKGGVISCFLQSRKSVILNLVASTLPKRATEQKILHLLTMENVPVVILKGSAIAQEIYKDINSRMSCDVDLLIKESQIEVVDEILLKNGYERLDQEPLCFLRVRRHHTTYVLKNARQKIPIEIHWSFSIPGLFTLSSIQIWEHIEIVEDGTYRLSPAMVYISLLMHHQMHAFKQFRNVIDLYWGLYEYELSIDWSELVKQIDVIGLKKTTGIALAQIGELWPESCDAQIGYQYLSRGGQQMDTMSFRLIYPLIKLEPHAGILDFKDKIVFRMAIDRWDILLFSFYKSVFPAPGIIKELFKDQKSVGGIMNYLRYWRWRFFS